VRCRCQCVPGRPGNKGQCCGCPSLRERCSAAMQFANRAGMDAPQVALTHPKGASRHRMPKPSQQTRNPTLTFPSTPSTLASPPAPLPFPLLDLLLSPSPSASYILAPTSAKLRIDCDLGSTLASGESHGLSTTNPQRISTVKQTRENKTAKRANRLGVTRLR